MTTFIVSEMTCGHCVKSITQAIQEQDANAELNFDLATKKVSISTTVSDDDLINLLDDVGFKAEISH